MPDYRLLIDEETWAFIDRTDSYYPPDAVDFTIAKQRAVYDRMCREFFVGHPEGVSVETLDLDGPAGRIPIRRYEAQTGAAKALVLYFHGGGFVVGGLDSHDDVCAEICAATDCEVVSVDYRLAPEHRHPAAFDDAVAAFCRVVGASGKPVVLAGDSAGGNLAAAVAHHTRRHPTPPIGQVLIYPGLGGDTSRGSYVIHADAPMLTVRDLAFYREIRGGSDADSTLSPLRDTDFSGLPPTVVITAECDPLSSDGGAYRDAILAAGGKVVWREEPGLVHGYLRARHSVNRARESFGRITRAIGALAERTWPFDENPL